MKQLRLLTVALFSLFAFASASAQTVTVTNPNGGNTLYVCQTYTVTWTQTGSPSNYWNIDYSPNNGATWVTVASNLLVTNGQFVWTVPNIQTNQALVRVTDAQNPGTTDASNSVFTINIPITVTAPNGGESWTALTARTISWNTLGTSNLFNIAYSVDAGSSWIGVVSSYTTATGTYNWNVPNNPSVQCRVRVMDAVTNCMVDISDANFTIIAATPILITPNGGESVYVACNYNITWNTSTFFSAVKLEYSTNNGSSWNIITSSTTNNGTYTWNVPNAISSNCLIRASNTSDLTIYDVSNAVFNIAPAVLVTTPNGGETLTGCNNYTITWNKSNCIGNWNIYYSVNNGTNWTQIANYVADNGSNTQSYSWYVPNNLSSTQGLIRVESYNYPGTYNDASNATFTFAPSSNIVVTAPAGTENVLGCSTLNITWTKLVSPCNTSYNIYYSTNNGTNYTYITSVTDNGTNFQSYAWTIPNGITSSQMKIKIESGNYTNISGISTGSFTVTPSNDITIVSPNGGETWQGLSTQNITWTNLAGSSGLYTIQYSTNGGSSWVTLATNYSGNSYSWTLPNSPSTTCQVRVLDFLNTCKSDVSNANFTITPATPILTAPNGGQTLSVACNYTITWNTATLYSTVNLYYSTNNGGSYTTIVTGLSNSGSYTWNVPNFPSANCIIKIANSADVNSFDVSNAVFTISPPVTVTVPNGGETWVGCTSYNITWSKSTCLGGYWNIYYSTNNGSTWTAIVNAVADNGSATQTYGWQVPNGITTTQALIKVESYYYPTSYFDQSNGTFTINPSTDITITAPNGGQTLSAGSSYTITWTNTANVSGNYTIQFYNGSSWTTIANNITGNSYLWTVPNTSSTGCLIRIYDTNNSCRIDQSDAVFTVTPSGPVLLSPNGGETLYINCVYPITWTASTFISPVKLEYSTNNGNTWVTIISSTTNNGTYNWTVPNTVSANCLIRASNTSDLSLFDVSDAIFTIAPAVTVTSPNGGETLNGCSNFTITWNKSTCVGNWNIYYSTNNGSTWTAIATFVTNTGANNQSYTWTVPNNLTGSQGRIRVESYNSPSTYNDMSDAAFTFQPNQNITVTSPNGNETLTGCYPFNITWSKLSSCNTYYNIQYSLDNGTTWNNIISAVADNGSTTQTYIWNVPNTISSTKALIKVISYDYNNIFDVSNAVFSVNPSDEITVTSPNGGQTWQGLSTQIITWSNLPGASGLYSIQYSTNNGSTWTNIVTNITGNSYSWTVPNIPSSQCLIKVLDFLTPCKFDVSNANFTISPATPILLTPNGGQTFNVGCTTSITWNTSTFYSTVNLYYSVDNGTTYTVIATNQTNNGSYTWTIPNFPSTSCLVKVANNADVTIADVSDVVFTIRPSVTITTPNGGETWNGCSTQNITWTKSTCVSAYWNIYYSTDNGGTWNTIVTFVTDNGSLTQSYAWTIPNTITTTQALIKVEAYSSPTAYNDVSNGVFNIYPSSDITLTNPNGGNVIAALSTYTITWTNLPTASGQYVLQYSTNGGSSWVTIVSNITGNSYVWTVPNASSTTCLVRVYDFVNSCKIDQSDAVFTITPPQPVLLTPNGGESLQIACSYNITWNSNTFYSPVKLEYSTNGGATWFTIIASTTNNGTYGWLVPNTVSANILVRASNTADASLFDVSDNILAIPAAVSVTLPNGGESLIGCSNYNITWTKSNCIGNWNIYYSTNSGSTWNTIASNVSNNGLVTQTYGWYVPNNISTTQGRIRVESATSPSTYNDMSNADFSITPNQNIIVTSPNGNETWTGCNTFNITWTKSASPCNTSYDLYYSLNNGSTWVYITSVTDAGTTSQTFSWTLPAGLSSTQGLIRVQSGNFTNIFDVSNNVFNFIPSNDVTVTSPNGGQVIQGLTNYTINWSNSIYASGLYNVYYSTNGGSSWTTLTTNYSGNSYTWSVPNVSSTTCLVRVMDYLANCRVDQSDAVFTIVPATPILITPNGGENLFAGNNYNITWNTTNMFSTVNLYYSLNNGSTWTTIVTSIANSGSYTWSVPNANSTTCLVRIANSSDITVKDESNAVFTINPAVQIITPNGGESLGGCTVTSITFNRSSAYTSYTLQYSTNNGTTWQTITSSFTASTSPASYTWTLPNLATTQALVKVIPNLATTYFDVSDAVFTITKPVTIIQPNFGGILQVGSNYNITWSSDGISNVYDIFYSTNGGASFSNIITAYNTVTNQYSWTVPNTPSTNCKIWIRDNTASCKNDTSDVAFTISSTAPPITLLTPNGGETLNGCQSYNITWSDSPVIGTYNIDYTTNGGTSYTNIATNYATTSGSYSWVVPNGLSSSNVLIRVRSSSVPSTFDLSDAAFTVNTSSMTVTTNTTVCSGTPLQLNASGGINYTWSPATGLSSTSIANPIATNTSSITYTVTSTNGTCTFNNTVAVTVVTGSPAASVAISASPSNTICTGTTVTLTATPTNGGTAPTYQWKVNGSNVGTGSTYISSSLSNTQTVTCVMTSGLACVTGNPATSNALVMNVQTATTPAVTIASSAVSICYGTNVSFTATPTNGGTTPSYQWRLNGSPVGTNANTYTNATLNSGDVVSCVMTSSALCNTAPTATSNNITMIINAVPTAPLSITGNTNICANSSNNYSIISVIGATSYTWTLPSGWSGSSTSTSISTTSNTTGGYITVTANNACGSSTTQGVSVNVNLVPSQPGAITGNTTICSGTLNTYQVSSVSGATSYTWTLPSGWTGTSATNAINATSSTNSGNITVTANNSCGASTSQTIAINVNTVPTQPGTISGNQTICSGSTNTYTISAVSGASSYSWTLPSGWSGASSTTSITAQANTTSGNVSVVANNTCGASVARTYSVTVVTPPTQPGTILGSATVCSNATATYSVAAVAGASSYNWILPSGWTGSSSSNIITATVGVSGGTILVSAVNSCGVSSAQSLAVNVNSITAQPGAISGNNVVCSGTTNAYSISGVSGATSYTWTLPSGWSGSSTSTSINATAGANAGNITVVANNSCGASQSQTFAVTVNTVPPQPDVISGPSPICFNSTNTYAINPTSTALSYTWTLPSGWIGGGTGLGTSLTSTASTTSGNVTVIAVNACGNSTSRSFSVTVTNAPAQPGTISGLTTICVGNTTTYSVVAVSGATSYTWTLPSGWSGNSTTNSISTTAGATGGIVSVSADNSCGTSTTRTVSITVNSVTAQPGAISGNTTICSGTSNIYTIAAVSGATSYTWTLPNGWTGSSTSTSITTTASTTAGNISVVANFSCGASAPSTLGINVNTTPAQPTSVFGANSICQNTTNTYSVTADPNATSYLWTLPSGWSGTSTTNIITATAGTVGGNITVRGVNGCGNGTIQTYSVTVNTAPIQPGTISGLTSICATATTTYSVAVVSGAISYNWSLPSGWSGTSTSNVISATAGTSGGSLTVSTTNGCGTSGNQSLAVTVNPIPSVTATGTASICIGQSTALQASGATSYVWIPASGLSSTIIANPTANPSTTTTYTVTGTTSGCSASASVTVTVNSLPIITASGAATICNGGSTTLNANGGVSYTWLPSASLNNANISNPVASPTSTTTYTVSGQGSNGCSSNATVIVVVNPIPTVSANPITICSGQSGTLTATVSPTGGNYSWSTGQTTASVVVNPTSTTTYTLTYTSLATCSNVTTVAVAVVSAPIANAGSPATICSGSSTNLNASGGTTYSWSPGTGLSATNIANPVASPTSTTTYTVTVGNGGSCTSTSTVTITVNSVTGASAGSNSTITCGNSTTLNASGGTTYSWTPSSSLSNPNIANPVATPTITTTYTVVVSNGLCSANATVTVTVGGITASAGSNVTISCGGSTNLNASGGTIYSWTPAASLSNPNISNPVATPAVTTTYTVTVGNGTCSSNATVTVTVGTLTANAGSNVTICSGQSTTLNGSVIGGTGSAYVNIASSYPFTQAVNTYTAITGGTIIWDNNTATMDDQVSAAITIPTFKFNNVNYTSLYVSSNGFVTFGIAPTTTNYNPLSSTETYTGAISALGLDLNRFSATGTSEVRYQQVGNEFVIQWQEIGRYSTAQVALDRISFQIRLNTSTNQVKIVYSNFALLGASANNAEIGLRGPNNTFATNINNRNIISTTGAWVNSTAGALNTSTCYFNSATPTTVPASGTTFTWTPATGSSATYSWAPSTGLSSTTILNPVANPTTTTTYTLTAIDGSCTSSSSVTITVNPQPVATVSSNVSICSGNSTTLTAGGGTTYNWSPSTGLSSTTIANPVANPTTTTTYTVIVGNGTGCTSSGTVLVTVNTQPTAVVSSNVTIACGGTTTLTATGGSTYSWSPTTGLSSSTISNPVASPSATTTYTVTVANGNCTSQASVTVTVGSLTANAGSPVTICSGNSTTLNGSSTGGGSSWVNVATSYTFTQNVASYTAITGGTQLYNTTTTMDELTGAVAIPAFTFNNLVYNQIYISTNGFITFGATAPSVYPAANYNTPISGTDAWAGCVSGWGADLDASTAVGAAPEIRYQQVGNEFVIQFKDVTRYNLTDRFSFQIRLNTSTNQIKVVYNTVSANSASTAYGQVGLRGANNTFASNVNNRSVLSTTGAWVNSVAGTLNTSSVYLNSATPTTVPAAGTTYIWTPQSTAATTYSWAPTTGLSNANIANPVASPTVTTTYTLTATSGSCSAQSTVTVTVGSSNLNAGANSTICNGSSTTLNATGATSYNWNPSTGLSATNIANPVASPTVTTTYTVTGITGTCSNNGTVTVNVTPVATISINAPTICAGQTATLTATPSLTGGTYVWSNSATTQAITANPITTTTYSVTYTRNSCTSSASGTITVNALPVVSVNSATICAGQTATLTANGASSYTWSAGAISTGANTATASPTVTTNYTVTGTTSGCSSTAVASVNVNTLNATVSSNVTICSGNSTNLVASGGSSYTWSPSVGLSATNIANPVATPSATTTYTVNVSNGICSTNLTVVVTVLNNTANAGSDVTICEGASTTLSASGGGTYSWSPSSGLSNANIANPIANPTTTTTYTVVASSACGSASASVTVFVTPAPIITTSGDATICAGSSTNLSASGASSYVWSPASSLSNSTISNPIATPTNTTTYTVIGTVGLCSSTSYLTVSTSTISVSASGNATICSGNSAPLNASGASTYNWSPSTGLSSTTIANPTANPTSTTTYTVIGSNGVCSASAQVTVTVNSLPTTPVAIVGSASICAGSSQVYSVANDPNISTYLWVLPSGWIGTSTTNSITVTTNGNGGTISIATQNNCGVSGFQTLAVNIVSPPTVTFAPLTNVCDNANQFILAGGSPSGGAYSGTGVIGGVIFSPAASGIGTFTITYTYTDASTTCSNTATQTQQVDLCIGIAENDESNGMVNAYPNPFHSGTTFSIGKNLSLDKAAITVFDMLGKKVTEIQNITTDKVELKRNDLNTGVYFYQFTNADKVIKTGKLIIE
jgi:PKD-like domain/Secretion system C-terminal sorting domain/Ser-Thr-rich glycosyl-phosphatidyl-inositol-anchored membrane family